MMYGPHISTKRLDRYAYAIRPILSAGTRVRRVRPGAPPPARREAASILDRLYRLGALGGPVRRNNAGGSAAATAARERRERLPTGQYCRSSLEPCVSSAVPSAGVPSVPPGRRERRRLEITHRVGGPPRLRRCLPTSSRVKDGRKRPPLRGGTRRRPVRSPRPALRVTPGFGQERRRYADTWWRRD